jgi:hypothetical protein
MAAAKVDEAELARRQAFLRAQRELLLAKKNKERYRHPPRLTFDYINCYDLLIVMRN